MEAAGEEPHSKVVGEVAAPLPQEEEEAMLMSPVEEEGLQPAEQPSTADTLHSRPDIRHTQHTDQHRHSTGHIGQRSQHRQLRWQALQLSAQ